LNPPSPPSYVDMSKKKNQYILYHIYIILKKKKLSAIPLGTWGGHLQTGRWLGHLQTSRSRCGRTTPVAHGGGSATPNGQNLIFFFSLWHSHMGHMGGSATPRPNGGGSSQMGVDSATPILALGGGRTTPMGHRPVWGWSSHPQA
jgi:hypothetical protein